MKNLTGYNKFVNLNKLNKINEEVETDTGQYGKGAAKVGGDDDVYFANVKGNLAGAENTLVGAALIKLFGFLKRKGMQAYLNRVLKPKLGKIYMNGILRYSVKNGVGNFSKKQWFNINKVEDGKVVEFESDVSFQKDELNGLRVFEKGSKVIKKDGEVLEDGKYKLIYNDAVFDVEKGIIISIKGNVDSNPLEKTGENPIEKVEKQGKQEIIDVDDDELETYRKKLQEKFKDKESIKADDDIIMECERIINSINSNIGNLDNDDIPIIKKQIEKIDNNIKSMKKMGLKEIEDLLKKENLKNREEIQKDKLVYEANILQLLELRKFLIGTLDSVKEKELSKVDEPNIKESRLFEADGKVEVQDKGVKSDVVPGRLKVEKLGDELKEIAKSGDAIDLNDENFYKQFESESVRKEVSKEILNDKPSIAKLQLTAEKIIAGNNKLDNNWKRMVESVKGMYSNFIVTDMVDPYTIIKEASDDDINKWKKQNNSLGNPGSKLETVKEQMNASNNPFFKSSTESVRRLANIGSYDLFIVKLEFSFGGNDDIGYYIVENVKTDYKDMKFYRIIGTIEYDKIEKHEGDKFTDLVKKSYSDIIMPEELIDKSKGIGIRSLYIVYGSSKHLSTGTSNNNISMMYLYSTKEDIDFGDKESYFFKIKDFRNNKEYTLPSEGEIEPKKNYKCNLKVDETSLSRITKKDKFIEYKDYDITNDNVKSKMNGINTLFN
ncbi:MAG: hypothetical protein ACOCV1_04920 [Bacillota bacterium]